jgi:hypothetical protein
MAGRLHGRGGVKPFAQSAAALLLVLACAGPRPLRGEQDPFDVVTFCTPYPLNTRPPVMVHNGDELQNALDDARAGDTIVLAAGSTFRPVTSDGSFVLRNRSIPDGEWVVIRSSSTAFDSNGQIPPNKRVTPADAKLMPQLRATRPTEPVIRADAGAHGYRLVGLDIGVDPGVSRVTALVELGGGGDTTPATEPHDIVIDRSYVHGNDAGDFRRGVAMNGARLAVIESHLDNFHDSGDSQAILGWNGPGPFKIVNNFLEAASENVMFGGADPRISGLVPADIEIRRNLMTKRVSWKAAGIPVKNAFELKNARRVLVEGNIFEHVWASGQDGTAILLKSTNQDGRCPLCVTEYVTFRHNIVRHAANGLLINAAETGKPGAELPVRANHIRIDNVLFTDIGAPQWGSGAKLLRIFGGVADVAITHITSTDNGRGILDPRDVKDVNPNLVFSYNVVERRMYGIGAGSDEGVRTLSRNFPQATYKHNVLVNTSEGTSQAISDAALKAKYPASTSVARGWDDVGFQPGTYRLAAGSPFRRAGDDGKDLGVDMDALEKAQAGPGGSAACAGAPKVPTKPRQQQPAR